MVTSRRISIRWDCGSRESGGSRSGYHDLTEADFQESYNVGSFAIGKTHDEAGRPDRGALKQTYCGSIGAEYMHITSTEGKKRWIQQRD